MFVFNLLAFKKKNTQLMTVSHGNCPYCEILTKKEPIRTFRFPLRLPCHIIKFFNFICLSHISFECVIAWFFCGVGYFFPEVYSNKYFCTSFCLRTLAPLFAGSVFAWSISKGYKHGFPLGEHLAFLLFSVVCFLCILFSCLLPKGLNSRKAVPVRASWCENCWKVLFINFQEVEVTTAPVCPGDKMCSVSEGRIRSGRQTCEEPAWSKEIDVFKQANLWTTTQ